MIDANCLQVGVDMISMDGFDCAGHPGEADIGNWVLFAKVPLFQDGIRKVKSCCPGSEGAQSAFCGLRRLC